MLVDLSSPERQRVTLNTSNVPNPTPVQVPEGWYTRSKARIEFVLALGLLVVTAPLHLAAALLVKLTSRGPVLYSQVRLGKDGKPFTIYKLRTMTHNCEKETGPRWTSAGDPHITAVGHFLRRTHLDELPQLWNIVRGEMSLIGPRPERPEFVPALEQQIPGYRARLLVRPGLTGLAQVTLPADTNIESVRRKLMCDLEYINRLSWRLDVRLLLCTALKVVGVPFKMTRWLVGLKRTDLCAIKRIDPSAAPSLQTV